MSWNCVKYLLFFLFVVDSLCTCTLRYVWCLNNLSGFSSSKEEDSNDIKAKQERLLRQRQKQMEFKQKLTTIKQTDNTTINTIGIPPNIHSILLWFQMKYEIQLLHYCIYWVCCCCLFFLGWNTILYYWYFRAILVKIPPNPCSPGKIISMPDWVFKDITSMHGCF